MSAAVTPFLATLLTLYPDMFPGPLGQSLAGTALKSGIWQLKTLDIRGFATDRHASVDDTPAGGGAGMVLRVDVLARALDTARLASPDAPVVVLTPRGTPLTQAMVRGWAAGAGITLVCGRFEGFDERLFEGREVNEVSVGDYVLSGGEPAALIVLDAIVRLLPGVLGSADTLAEESFEAGLLEYPHYTRPRTWEGREIPEVLLSGDHAKIAAWRKSQAEERTRLWRPDLWARYLVGKK
jgi:tRNA (guanine37-N1)-methyltransferase